ncbi:hypothetical protein GUJ93_ZPchr0004g38332 [Zizania palustris]|uniref:Uncharacterized protein n=1 Tax=Zizania palustris TaxID=103762 RepID=A0A8J5VNL0_ZIZPA|nr:hypothetical protein GUJ93_ZPchr0004g38332 [Zizania palustris]
MTHHIWSHEAHAIQHGSSGGMVRLDASGHHMKPIRGCCRVEEDYMEGFGTSSHGVSSLYKSHALFPLLLHKPTPLPLPPSQPLSSSLLPPLSVVATMPHRSSGKPPSIVQRQADTPHHRRLFPPDYDAIEEPEFYPEVPPSLFSDQEPVYYEEDEGLE